MLVNHDYSVLGSEMTPRHAEKKTAEKLYMNRLEELTKATDVAFQNYQMAVERRRRSEQERRWEIAQLHQALDGLFRTPACI
ncbi:hypothetical protein AAVH_13363 [Aphelenchoides avenae]|nr:hypothetical protein AAVH_13363 [Aphelenchus avenae]